MIKKCAKTQPGINGARVGVQNLRHLIVDDEFSAHGMGENMRSALEHDFKSIQIFSGWERIEKISSLQRKWLSLTVFAEAGE